MREPARSAVPLAATGIICLGLVPTLGGPDRPLHWAMTLGMVGFGVLLHVRHRLRRSEGPLREVPQAVARKAARNMLLTVGVIVLLMGGVLVARFNPHAAAAPLSLGLPLAALAWLAVIGFRVRGSGSSVSVEAVNAADRPSRRPSNWDALSSAGSGRGKAASSHVGV